MVCKIITIGGALSVVLLRAYTERTIPALLRQSLQLIVQKKKKKKNEQEGFLFRHVSPHAQRLHLHHPDKMEV